MTAMALYFRYAEIGGMANGDVVKTAYAIFRYLNVAEQVGLYDHAELLKRLHALASYEMVLPEVRYMIAVHTAQIDPRRGLHLAEAAACAAQEARGRPIHLPTDTRIEWLSLRLAAACAAELKSGRAREIAERAIAAGAPRGDLVEFLG